MWLKIFEINSMSKSFLSPYDPFWPFCLDLQRDERFSSLTLHLRVKLVSNARPIEQGLVEQSTLPYLSLIIRSLGTINTALLEKSVTDSKWCYWGLQINVFVSWSTFCSQTLLTTISLFLTFFITSTVACGEWGQEGEEGQKRTKILSLKIRLLILMSLWPNNITYDVNIKLFQNEKAIFNFRSPQSLFLFCPYSPFCPY